MKRFKTHAWVALAVSIALMLSARLYFYRETDHKTDQIPQLIHTLKVSGTLAALGVIIGLVAVSFLLAVRMSSKDPSDDHYEI